MLCRFASLLVVAASLAAGSVAAQPADPAAGRAIAERWCTGCHVIDEGQRRGTDAGPSFFEIAANPSSSDPARLAEFLARPHRVMPGFEFGRRDILDLIAFLATRRR